MIKPSGKVPLLQRAIPRGLEGKKGGSAHLTQRTLALSLWNVTVDADNPRQTSSSSLSFPSQAGYWVEHLNEVDIFRIGERPSPTALDSWGTGTSVMPQTKPEARPPASSLKSKVGRPPSPAEPHGPKRIQAVS